MEQQAFNHLALSESGFLFDSKTGHTYTLNRTGAFILKQLIQGIPKAQIVAAMCSEWNIPEKKAAEDVAEFLSSIVAKGLVDRSVSES